MLHDTWLLMELAAQRIRQELRDAETARRARLAEATFHAPGGSRGGRGVVLAVWGAVRGAAYAVARAVR
ncbi:MAG: hypothetical protein QN151_00220 [Armatimonadota bacterium]|nr:hypothetical protein [Armatimonadota bacterium]MDR7589166.1 hypothetical protein [Armatimonadota bacterium]MDR7607161.1 hypothetical protein [Armatimonadota bacterium]